MPATVGPPGDLPATDGDGLQKDNASQCNTGKILMPTSAESICFSGAAFVLDEEGHGSGSGP
ncbi:hypothetical protein ASG54_20215 [Aureimonas sp. Leaf460]|nr:hypothetical protein ASG62_09830 [Aureimonas sp. Leaf427]KQT70931.1 hypothetical protein ASG54_20215 [Aureimonas sp. Leaf460]